MPPTAYLGLNAARVDMAGKNVAAVARSDARRFAATCVQARRASTAASAAAIVIPRLDLLPRNVNHDWRRSLWKPLAKGV
jgi:hypothetical protein